MKTKVVELVVAILHMMSRGLPSTNTYKQSEAPPTGTDRAKHPTKDKHATAKTKVTKWTKRQEVRKCQQTPSHVGHPTPSYGRQKHRV